MGSIKMLTSVIIATSCFLVSSAQKTVCTEEALADIVFLVDGSWSIGTENYQKIRDFLLTLVNSFDVGPDKVRIGLVQYSNTARTEFYLNSYEDKQKILNYLANLPYMGGGTKTGLGLDFLLTEHFVEEAGSRAKEQVPQIAVVITDGQSQDDVESHAQQLKRQGITLYAIGIKDADMEQLKEIATMPHDQHIYSVSDFTALQGISQSFIQVLCTTVEEAKRQVSQVLQGCRANLADIVFLVDSSSSIGDENFLKVKQFLHKFIEGLDIRPDGIQVGVAQFSNDPYTEFLLGQYADKDELLEKVDNLVYRRGGTETGKALVFLRNNYFTVTGSSRASQNVPQIAVVITDGDSSDNMKKPAMELREKGVFIFTLGVGAANITELQSIANKPYHRFLVSFSNYQALLDGTTSMSERVCMSIEAQQQVPTPKFADVFVLVDSSAVQIQQIRQILNRLANQLNVSRTSNRLAVAQFGRDVSLEFLFNAYKTKNELLTLIQKFQLKSTLPRNLGKAMDHVRTQFLNAASGSRIAQGYKQVLLVLSAGPSDDNALTAVRALKDDGVTIVNVDFVGTDYSARKTIIAPPQQTFTLVRSSVPQIVQNVKTVLEAEEVPGVTGECRSAQVADIVFIVDGSDSITLQNFKLLRESLHRVIKGMQIGLDNVRVGMVLYGEIPRAEFHLNSFENKSDILQYIKVLPHLGGEGNTPEALKIATKEVFTKSHGSRRHIGVQQIAVVITEGNFIDNSTIDAATNLRRSGVQVYALSVTQDNTKQLEKIASYPPRKFVFTVKSFTKLKKIENILRTTLCVNVVGSTVAKARRYNIKQGCIKTEEADIYFLIDHSGSILDKDFQDMKKFILEFLLMFSIGPKMVRIGVVKFADAPTLEFSLIDHTDRSSVEKAVSSIEQKGGGTQTGKGLSYMIQRFKKAKETRDSKVQEILIVITDGKSQDSVMVPAQTLRDQGVNIYAIGVKDANWEELLEIAGSQTKTFLVTNFDALKPLKNEIATDICSEDACKTMRADVIFLLDGSWSIASQDFSKMKTFLNSMISKLKIEKDSVQFGVLQFSTQTKVEFALNRFYNKDQMKAAVMAMKQLSENTLTGGALHVVSEYFNGINGGRSDVPQILIIITDGEAQDDVAEPAKNLRDKGVTIYSIGVASANITQLREISGSPDKVYLERDFDALHYLDEDLLLKICSSDDCLKSQVADVVFLVDDSSSIAYDDFESMKFFMKSVVNSTQVGENYVRFCTILYSDNPEVKFPLNKYYNKREVRDAISDLKHFGGNTYTAKGLQYSQAYFRQENGGRGTSGVPQMLFVITDGEATDPYDLAKHSEELQKNGIDIYGIGVANATKKELLIMTKDENKVFHVKDFDALKALQWNISKELCKNSKPECKKKSADLVILIDGSESIEEDPWKIMMNFMLSLVDSLRIQPDLFRIGVAQFSYEYAKEFYLNEYTNGEQVKKAILSINQMKQGTRIGHGLNGVQEFFQASKGSRISEGIAQNLLLITDGKSSDDVYAAADSLKAKGIKMFVIGIGNISKQQLKYIAGSSGSVFYVDSFDQLKLNKTTQQVIDIICNEPIPDFSDCTVDIGIGFDISRVQDSSQPLLSGQYKLQVYFSEIIKYISTLYNLCCLTKPTLQTNVGFHVVAKDGTIIYETNFEAYNEKVVKKVMAVERTEALALNTQLLRSFQDKFKRSNAGVKIVIIFTDGPDALLQDLMLASENLRKSGVHALLTVALEGVQSTIDLQRLEFGRGFGYKDPLTIGMQSVSSAIQKQIDAVASRECCNVLCTCTGHEGVRGPRGPPGTNGLPGQRGHLGFPGEEGGIGDRGPPGLNGTQGHQGCPGKRGLKGGRGYRGDMGEDGEHGLDGVNGEQGKTGEAGARGERGDPGSTGQRGVRGTPGDSGSKGLRGDPGESGSDSIIRGPKGEIGNPGLLGDMGPDGSPGSRGELGKPGQPGRRGARGVLGIRGPAGEPGLPGIPGPSGPLSSTSFNAVRGPKGMPGLKGPHGFTGPQGGIGPKGNIGPRGPKGQPGDSGEKGAVGPLGTRGLPGTDGQDGYGTPGPKGQKGDSGFPGYPGYQGESGTSGTKGANGQKGNRGKRGSAGRSGPPGEPGTVGYAGNRGPKGPPGARAMSTCQLVTYVRDNCVCCKANAACPAYPTELVFGLDMSEGVNPTLFERMRLALLSFLENINMAESNCPTGARVAVVAYSSNVKYLIRFSDYQRKTQLVEAVKNIALERTTNRRNIGAAMRFVGRNIFKRVRQSALMRKVAIFFTVAPSQDLTSINTAVLEYKAANINLGVIAYRNVPNVRRAFEADETGSFILSVIERPRDESAALQRIQQCVICFDFCNPARGCPSVSDTSAPKEVDVDLAMLVDSSRNIQADQYEGIKQVLGSVLDQIAVSSQPNTADKQARVALYQQSSSYSEAQAPVKEVFTFQQYRDRNQMKQSMFRNLQQTGGSSKLGQAIEYTIMSRLLTTPKPRKNKMMIVIVGDETDYHDSANLDLISTRAQCQGVMLLILTVGDRFNCTQVEELASFPNEQHIIHLNHVKLDEQEYARRFVRTFFHFLNRQMNTYPALPLRPKCASLQQQGQANVGILEAAERAPIDRILLPTVTYTEEEEEVEEEDTIYRKETGTQMKVDFENGGQQTTELSGLNAQCLLDMDAGTVCGDYVQRWYYDRAIDACSPFWYGGCGGNSNRFSTGIECSETCVVHRLAERPKLEEVSNVSEDTCLLKQDEGTCQNFELKWYYDTVQNECSRFWFGGCGGNSNRFDTQEECEARCVRLHTASSS